MNNRGKYLLSSLLLAMLFSLPLSAFAALGDYTGDSFNTGASGNLSARGVVEYNGFFWITDDTDDEVYKYNPDGTYTGVSFNTAASGNGNPLGITAYNDFFWITDDADNEVYKYNPDGTYTGVSFDITASGNANPVDITAYNDFFWITDSTDGEVYKYNPDGTYTATSFDTAASGNGAPRGIVYYNNFFWITDDADDEIYKFNSDGTYAGVSYDTAASGNGNPLGIATYNDFLWVTDDADDSLYKYNPDGTYAGTSFYFGFRPAPMGITAYDDFFWVTDLNEAEVYKYETDLTYTGVHFDTAGSGNGSPQGIIESGGFFWVTDITDGEVYKYNLDGTYAGISFDTAASGNTYPSGITYLEDFFWISDYFQDEVYKYNPDGTYTGIHFDTATAGNTFSQSITSYDGFLWTVSDGAREVYKYSTAGVYQAFSFDTLGSGNSTPGGIIAYDNSFWITDYVSNYVYRYEGADVVAPTVDTLTPLDDAVGVVINSNLIIEFDEDVDVESGNISIFKSSDDTLIEAIDVTGGLVTGTGTTAITINPTADLEGDTSYYIQIDATAFDDASGNSYSGIADETTWNFTTVDTTNPTVSNINPLDGAIDVAINTNLIIEFSEAVDAESGNIVIKNAVGDVVVETIDVTGGQVTGSGTITITIDPLVDLVNGTSYYIQIDATAFDDVAGNSYAGVADTTSWNFSTVALPEVLSGGGSSGSVRHPRDEEVTPVITTPSVVESEPEIVVVTSNPNILVTPVTSVPPRTENPTLEVETENEILNNNTSETSSNNIISPIGIDETIPSNNKDKEDKIKSSFDKEDLNVAGRIIALFGLLAGFLTLIPTGVSEISLHFFELWSIFLYGVGLKKRNRPWGVVYDSVTKQPLDPVYVVLSDLNGQEIATSITDMDGRYGFLVPPGSYRIKVNKDNYTYPSAKLAGKSSDELYNDLYFGDVIEIKEQGEVISKNIPMDQVNFNWNEFAKLEQGRMRFYHRRDLFMGRLSRIFFTIGFFASVATLFLLPKPYNIIIFCLYIVLFLLRRTRLAQNRRGSVVYEDSKVPLSYGILRLYSKVSGVEIAHTVLDKKGNYYMLIQNGNYAVSVEKKNDDGSYVKVFSSSIEIKHGILKKQFQI